MRLSILQKFILKQCFAGRRCTVSKKALEAFYGSKKIREKSILTDITKSIERLIAKDMIIGIGRKTSHKWIFQEIELTSLGRRVARGLLGKQQKLPLKSSFRRKNIKI